MLALACEMALRFCGVAVGTGNVFLRDCVER